MKANKVGKSQKEPVRLREKELSNGSKSLYLDIYRDGKREYEFLKLYLVKATTPIEREQNRQTLATAQAIKSKRQIEIQNGEYGFTKQFKIDTPFLEYYRKMCEDRHKSPDTQGNWGNWRSCLKYLEIYCDEKTTFKDIDSEWIEGFKEYLNTVEKDTHKRTHKKESELFQPLSQNSKLSYFNKLRACINQAFDDRIIPVNPMRGVEGFKQEETERAYLTLEEVKKLAATPCKYPYLKNSFMFSCLTGLRKSDIEKLTWGEVQKFGEFTRIVFKQKKTKGQEYLDITPEAESYLGVRGAENDRVFTGFKYGSWTLLELKRWVLAAGITKDITFHCGRHTFAVLMLELGADIYTVSKLLGHRELATTQIYAKVVDKKKQEAVSLIPNITGITDSTKKKNDYISKCRYYRGETSAPAEFEGKVDKMFWFYESAWVTEMNKPNGSELLEYSSIEYNNAGLLSWNEKDGTPYFLKVLLFNRFNHWLGGYGNDAEYFKRWYMAEYMKSNNV